MLRREATIENIRVGLDALRIHPVRTLLSVLGILISAGSLVTTMAVSDGLVAFARRTVERETPIQVVVVSPRTARFEEGEWLPVRGWPEFTERDAAEMAILIPGVQAAAVILGGRATARAADPVRERRSASTRARSILTFASCCASSTSRWRAGSRNISTST